MAAPITGVAAYCGHCGTAFGPRAAFCPKCGFPRSTVPTAVPTVAPGWAYPVVPVAPTRAGARRLSSWGFLLTAALLLGALVSIGTALLVSQTPTTTYCHFSCGPDLGPRLVDQTAYRSSEFGYRVGYESPFKLGSQSSSGVELNADADNFMNFSAASGTDVNAALQKAVSGLNTNEFQDLHSISTAVAGAEIGYVPGAGEAFSATFVDPGSNFSEPVSVVAMAASQANLTISVLAVGSQDMANYENLPLGFKYGPFFDFEVSNTAWPGQA